jgi:hypothetical protein
MVNESPALSAAWIIADSATLFELDDPTARLFVLGWIVERVEKLSNAMERSIGATALYSPNLRVFVPALIASLQKHCPASPISKQIDEGSQADPRTPAAIQALISRLEAVQVNSARWPVLYSKSLEQKARFCPLCKQQYLGKRPVAGQSYCGSLDTCTEAALPR